MPRRPCPVKGKVVAVLFVVIGLHAMSLPAAALQVNDVAGEFIWNFGSNKLLSHCEMPCGVELRGFIKEQIRKGLGEEQIIQYMKVNFKEAILAAPEKKGFNLVAWITPFAVVGAGAFLINRVVNQWASRRRDGGGGGKPPQPQH